MSTTPIDWTNWFAMPTTTISAGLNSIMIPSVLNVGTPSPVSISLETSDATVSLTGSAGLVAISSTVSNNNGIYTVLATPLAPGTVTWTVTVNGYPITLPGLSTKIVPSTAGQVLPAKTLALYDATQGGPGTPEHFMAQVAAVGATNPVWTAAAALGFMGGPVGGTASPYDNKTVTGLTVAAGMWNTPMTVTGATFNNLIVQGDGSTKWTAAIKFVNCTFNNCQVVQPWIGTQFLACTFTGPQTLLSIGEAYHIWFANLIMNDCPRGLLVQLQTGWTNGDTRVMGAFLDNINGGQGHNELLLVESSAGATVYNLMADRVYFSSNVPNSTPGQVTVDNVAGSNITLTNFAGAWGGYYGYNTPDTSAANGQVSGLALTNWKQTGGRIQLGPQTISATLADVTITNPTLVGSPPGSPVFCFNADNGHGAMTGCQINGLTGSGLNAQYGFTGTVVINS